MNLQDQCILVLRTEGSGLCEQEYMLANSKTSCEQSRCLGAALDIG
jgi:hypothetical protein